MQLNAIDDAADLNASDDKVDVFDEPSNTLPLWRRVDRQYWWNEWLSKPLVDAGVRQARQRRSSEAHAVKSSTVSLSR